MTARVTGKFEILSWEQNPLPPVADRGAEGVVVTRTTAAHRFSGDIDGTAEAELLMVHSSEEYAGIVGVFRFEGSMSGRSGTCVISTASTFADGVVQGELTVVPGSGTGGLAGLAARGTYESEGTRAGSIVLDRS